MLTEVKAYKCSYCGKLFKNNYQHRACKSNPSVINCGLCVHHEIRGGYTMNDGFDYEPNYHACRKHLMIACIPRMDECAGFEKIVPKSPFDAIEELSLEIGSAGRNT